MQRAEAGPPQAPPSFRWAAPGGDALHHADGADRHDRRRADHAGAAALVAASPRPGRAEPSGTAWSPSFGIANSSARRCWARCPTATAAGRCCCWASGPGAELLRHRRWPRRCGCWSRAPGQRRDAGQCRGGQRLRGRHHAARGARQALRLLGAMFGIGFILGPVMGGLLGGSTCGCRSSWPARWRWPTGLRLLRAARVLPPERRRLRLAARQPGGGAARPGRLKGVGLLVG
jgi:hypothetical protein